MTTPIQPPAEPTPSMTGVGGFWFCAECPTIVVTRAPKIAAQHFDVPDQWTHWLWEFTFPSGDYPYAPTGREIHTSDGGGYYLSRPDSPHTPQDVWLDLARKFINTTVREKGITR